MEVEGHRAQDAVREASGCSCHLHLLIYSKNNSGRAAGRHQWRRGVAEGGPEGGARRVERGTRQTRLAQQTGSGCGENWGSPPPLLSSSLPQLGTRGSWSAQYLLLGPALELHTLRGSSYLQHGLRRTHAVNTARNRPWGPRDASPGSGKLSQYSCAARSAFPVRFTAGRLEAWSSLTRSGSHVWASGEATPRSGYQLHLGPPTGRMSGRIRPGAD